MAAKTLANKAFLKGKQKAEALLMAHESGLEMSLSNLNDVDVFQLQHHHLLACLERTTVHRHCSWLDDTVITAALSGASTVTP